MKTKLQQLRECQRDMVSERRRVNDSIARLKVEIVIEERLEAARKAAEERAAA